jgi:hypothetical protein
MEYKQTLIINHLVDTINERLDYIEHEWLYPFLNEEELAYVKAVETDVEEPEKLDIEDKISELRVIMLKSQIHTIRKVCTRGADRKRDYFRTRGGGKL